MRHRSDSLTIGPLVDGKTDSNEDWRSKENCRKQFFVSFVSSDCGTATFRANETEEAGVLPTTIILLPTISTSLFSKKPLIRGRNTCDSKLQGADQESRQFGRQVFFTIYVLGLNLLWCLIWHTCRQARIRTLSAYANSLGAKGALVDLGLSAFAFPASNRGFELSDSFFRLGQA